MDIPQLERELNVIILLQVSGRRGHKESNGLKLDLAFFKLHYEFSLDSQKKKRRVFFTVKETINKMKRRPIE